MKKLFVILLVLCTFVFANEKSPKVGCILAQDGMFSVNWSDENNQNGSFEKVKYTAIKPEGINFKEIFVGSKIQVVSNNEPLELTIVGIKSNPRVKPNPRTGTMNIKVVSEGVNKDVVMQYTYDKNIMKVKGDIDILGLKSIDFETKIKAVLCNI